jgi:membrane associated rhomboid family serine protease
VPANASAPPFALVTILNIIRSVFFHGGWSHLLGNMLYLFLFGDNVGDSLGWILYLVLYFGSGSAAARAQIAIDPTSTIVLVGGSSAIAGVLGNYFLFFPGVWVKGIVPLAFIAFLDGVARLDSNWLMVSSAVVQRRHIPGSGNAQWRASIFAHIGNFVFGMLLSRLVTNAYPRIPASERYDMLYQRAE